MKKFYYILVASLVLFSSAFVTAKTGLAGKQVKKVTEQTISQLNAKLHSKTKVANETFTVASVKTIQADRDAKLSKPGRSVKSVITDVEGESKFYTRSGSCYYRSATPDDQEGQIEIIYGDDNVVYFNDILGIGTGTYVKGTLEGNKITVDLPQTLLYWEAYGYGMELAWLDVTAYADGTVTNYYTSDIKADRDNTQAVFTIDGNTLSLEGSDSNYILAAVYDDDDQWLGVGDFESVYTLIEDLPEPIELPEGLTATTYYLNGSVYYSSASHDIVNQEVKVAKDGNDIYFQGLMTGDADYVILPEAWLKGTLEGNTVTVPMGQYAGTYSGSFMYAVGRGANGAGDFTLTYDAEAETFTFDNNLYVNGKPDEVYYYIYHLAGNVISAVAAEVEEPEPDPDLVEVPAGVTIEDDWAFNGNFNTQSSTQEVKKYTEVAIDGNDIYVKGLAYYFEDAWIKGTIDGDVATFAGGQFVGSDNYGQEFLFGSTGNDMADIEFAYDADNHKLTQTTPYILENGSNEEFMIWGYWTDVVIYQGELVEPEPVEAPEGLETKTYVWTTTLLEFVDDDDDEETEDVPTYTDETYQISIGVDGDDVYVQGLCVDLPDTWVKGTKNGNKVTFETGQFFGTQSVLWYTFDHYFVGYGANGISNVEFTYDEQTDTYTTDDWIIDNELQNSLNYFLIHTDNVWTGLNEVEGKPQAAEIVGVNLESTYPNIQLSIPTTDENGNIMNLDKVFYRLYSDIEKDIQLIEFTPEEYSSDFETTVTEIPYNHDGYDVYKGGATVYLNQSNIADFNQIGVQVVNYSGTDVPSNPAGRTVLEVADNESEIVWFKIKDYKQTGILDITSAKTVKSVRYVNAAGQASATPFDGLNIVVKTMSDGSVQVGKVVK